MTKASDSTMYGFVTQKLKKILFYFCLILLLLGSFELIVGYYLLQSNGIYETASARIFHIVKYRYLEAKAEHTTKTRSNNNRIGNNKNNPFITNVADDIPVKYQPFLDYANAYIESKKQNLNDFFGFRNSSNLYFSPRGKNDILILMTGGSECLGYTHPDETIIENIQGKLQLHTKKKINILNLCMNSYTLTNEIQAYVHLAFNLKPNLVITHSGWNDAIYGMLIPKEFVKAGLIYNKWQEAWLEKLYGSVKTPVSTSFSNIILDNRKAQITSYWRQIKKYNDIVSANAGKLLVGLQGYNPVIVDDDMASAHRNTHIILKELKTSQPPGCNIINFSNYHKIYYKDSIHTTQDSVDVIGDIYAEYILKTYPELFTEISTG